MSTIFALLYFVALVVFIVFIIRSGSKKKKGEDNRLDKRIWIISLAVFVIAFILTGVTAPKVEKKTEKEEIAEESKFESAPVPEPTATPSPTSETENQAASTTTDMHDNSITEAEETVNGNGVDATEWPAIAALEMPNDKMLALYKDFHAAIYSDEYPEDQAAIEEYEQKVEKEMADKYGIAPDQVVLVYDYVSQNYDKAATNGKGVSKTPKLSFGELKSVSISGSTAVVCAKIQANIKNDYTVKENYYNVGNLIKQDNYSIFDEIQYYAMMDTTTGEETKVISFTVPKEVIAGVANESILDNMLGDYVEDLWIAPQLQ